MAWKASRPVVPFRSFFIATLIAAIAAHLSATASAADFSHTIVTDTVEGREEINYVVRLDGPIVTGDAEQLAAIVSAFPDRRPATEGDHVPRILLFLHSPGGSFREGIELSRTVAEHNVSTRVEAGATCLSACAVVFMSGRHPSLGEGPSWHRDRAVEMPAQLGFHRPFMADLTASIPIELIRELTEKEIEDLFASEFTASFDQANQLIQQMLGVDPSAWSNDLLLRMLTATNANPTGSFVYLETVRDALVWDITVTNAIAVYPESDVQYKEAASNTCLNTYHLSGDYQRNLERSGFEELGLLSGPKGENPTFLAKRLDSKPAGHREDAPTYWTQVGEWSSCTVTFPGGGSYLQIWSQFGSVEHQLTGNGKLVLYHPSTRLDDLARKGERAEAGGSGADVASVSGSRCYVYHGAEMLDDEPCERSARRDPKHGLVETYLWPSGGKTVVIRQGGEVTVNGTAAVPEADSRGDVEFCYRNTDSGNTFCYADL